MIYIKAEDFVDPLLVDVAKKVYKQYEEGIINPALIISTYETEEEHSEVAALFSEELSDMLSDMEKERTLKNKDVKSCESTDLFSAFACIRGQFGI